MVRWLSLFAILILARPAGADLLFEGYSKVVSGGVPIGYSILRYEFDPKSKHFVGTSFLKTGALGSDITESLKTVCDQDFNPVQYEYTSIVGKKTKTIDAKFKKGKMTAAVTDDGKKSSVSLDVPKGTFLSSFLVYLMLKSKTGLRLKEKYSYSAIAEEDAAIYKGEAFVAAEETHMGLRAFKVLNKFKDIKFISYVTDRGEMLSTSSPASGIGTELMAKPADAVGTFGTSSAILKNLFGDVPKGTDNIISKAALNDALKPSADDSKKGGVPPGKGLMVKPADAVTAKEGSSAPPSKAPEEAPHE